MSCQILINGIDKTSVIQWPSFQLDRALTNQVDSVQFSILRKSPSDYKASMLDDIKVYDGAVCIFGGQIIEVKSNVEGANVETVEFTAKDYSYSMDSNLVIDVYQNMTVNAIIADILSVYCSGFTGSNVNAPVTIGYIAFNYEYPSKCLQQLAELINYDWYVDENKDVHFFSKGAVTSPFSLTDISGNFVYDSLQLNSNLTNLRNTIIVRGGQYLGSLTSEKQTADGQAITYKQGYQYNTVFVKINGTSKTVGVDNIDDPTTKDCLYNYNEKFVRFPDSSKPTAGQVVEVGGYPYIPVIVKVKDVISVAQFGTREFKIIDNSIDSKQGARDRAQAEIASWAQTLNEGSFDTYISGLDTGQQININSTIRGVNQDYIISRISTQMRSPTDFIHSVTLVTTKTFGMVEFLQKLLMDKDKEIKISSGEVLDEVESANEIIEMTDSISISKVHNPQTESISINESVTAQSVNYPVEFCVGPQVPTGYKRQFILDGSPLA